MKLRIEKAIYGGAGLARAEGKAVFVPFALPSEEVEAHITKRGQGYDEAALDAVLEPSPERTAAACPYFSACGGCHYQHAVYEEQLRIKTAILHETLERARVAGIPEIRTAFGEPLGYRNRVRLHVQREPFALCYKRAGSHANLPVERCPIAAAAVQRAMEAVRSIGAEAGMAAWAEEVELFTNEDESGLLVTLWTSLAEREAAERLRTLWGVLRAELPKLAGMCAYSADRGKQTGRRLAAEGETWLRYRAAGHEYRVSAGAFFQVNRFLVDRFVELATGGRSGAKAWDLYAGVGLFTVPLAETFEEVTAVEAAAASVTDLRHNLHAAAPERKAARIVASDTEAFLRGAVRRGEKTPDLVVADPPRAGLGKDVTALLGQLKPAHITYVSCDPATLSRDLRALVESGYHLREMHLVDMFPHTFHIESVTQLTLVSRG
ncbi:23S rRNA (uracil(1939)-C(5))-methyltransferase RlmD [Paracidobacterium acidisoli]|uniref:23S rRNA (Uracil(1939)-C(5))-methyltransferase RlmD n=1 Tax=Paracidobacterium acidisoli TaxID=2303751 RepID=A0A372ILX3_9BACT|nr:23S rRNA (uracil(1939)-C(5))-methyltransferase RlmD [Paracidobacterium acidisoli]MBT9332484.1 23S rRNA (uracil(1939)-C(5))-methyltransferase RlmD [Paracidobacterium acidisoli]